MENYKWYSESGNLFELYIGDSKDRFNGEGIHQEVKISYRDGYLTWDVYETTYGRLHALSYFEKMEFYKKDLYDVGNELDKSDFNTFKNWIIESLTPIEIKRGEKIIKIKDKIDEII